MLYESAYTAMVVQVRDESPIYHQATGVEISRTKRLVADFGVHGGEVSTIDPLTGQPEKRAFIRGGFFDTEEAKIRLGWDDDEHASVVAKLDQICRDEPYLLAKVEHVALIADKPWPTYDETHWKSIPLLAEQLGLVEVTIAYERENGQRESVLSGLEAKQAESMALPASDPVPVGVGEITLG
jgi:hypothetical protein